MSYAIECQDLCVSYRSKGRGPIEAVRGLSFHVQPGEIVGFLGPNGAGKSSTLKALMGFVQPDSGSCRIFDQAAGTPAALRRVGYLPEVALYDLSSHADLPRVLTNFNQAFHDEIEIIAPTETWVDSTDGAKVHTWAIRPTGFDASKQYPAILQIHGGPHTQYGLAFFHEFQFLAAQGFVVVYSNPRGSKGYGEGFCAAIKGAWGDKDWDDVQAVQGWMSAQSFIDSKRMGVMGGSYGGYMTNWVIGHTDVFAAAITDRCVSNLVSMAGSSDFPMNKNSYFGGCAWGDLDEIKPLWAQSPIAFMTKAVTPTLIIHSEGDLRCNVEQGEQVFHALQAQNVPSRFVRYPQSTFHGLSRNGPPDLRLHRLGEIGKWMTKYLKA